MPKKLAFIICLGIVAIGNAVGQTAEPPLERRVHSAEPVDASPQQRFRRGPQARVYKARITPHWFAEGSRFWYRNDLSGGRREFILVDATKGEREPAFDHERLANALGDAGVNDVQADRLDLDMLQFDADAMFFRAGGRDWRCDLATYELSPIEDREPPTGSDTRAIHPDDAPRASKRTGAETELRFVNQTDGNVELFWLDTSGRRRSYGILAAGAERRQHTYAGHVWLALDADGNSLAAFEAPEQPGDAIISGKQVPRQTRRRRPRPTRPFSDGTSPDGKWRAFIRDG
ncbi:MAG: hypothetical protein JJ992_13260, partial [Planctomycetes bacterium]|nr:hypothetical protein [Planctomycetota bacterium]